jgi:hypothetical protein
MPRTEARVFTSIWKDPDFLALDEGAQRLYLFLISQEELSYCGVMPLRVPRWARKAAGLTGTGVEQNLKVLEGTAYPSANGDEASRMRPFVITDEDTGELFVRSLLRRDSAWKQPNLLKQARESAAQIESPRILGVLLAELRRLPVEESPSEQVRTLVAEFIADLEQGSPYPSAYPDPNPSGNPSADPMGDPTAEDHARARGLGECDVAVLGYPEPLIPVAPNSLPAQSRKNGSRLPDDFAVTADLETWARQHAPHVDPRRETERFCDYWRAKPGAPGRKLDWIMTWRNWMRTAEDRQGPRDRASPGSRQQAEQAQLERAMARAAQREGSQ